MKEVPLKNGMVALVDDEDFDRVNKFKWRARKGKQSRTWYAIRRSGVGAYRLHRFILNAPDGIDVDHKNHDGLDCRKENLRLATKSQNCRNMRKINAKTTSIYKGVCFSKKLNKWIAAISAEGKRRMIGCFTDEIEAGKAYDAAARFYFGEFACTNFEGTDAMPIEKNRARPQRTNRLNNAKYRGVMFKPSRNKWFARIRRGSTETFVGYFKTEIEAAYAYDKKVIELYGNCTRLNFPIG